VEVSSDIVGLKLKEHRTRVTWRQTTNFAAAVSDMNPLYFDDRRPEGIIAPPAFAFALAWPVLEKIYEYMELPYPAEIVATMVHYTEHVDYVRPLRPGTEVSVKGEVAAVLPRHSGTHVVFKFRVADPGGRLFHTEYIGGLLRGVRCVDAGRGAENLPVVPPAPRGGEESPGGCGEPLWEACVHIGEEAPYVYDGCTGLVFAIHTSPAFAEAVGLPGIILQGTATLSHAMRELVNREAGGDPMRLASISARFRAVVRPGTDIRVQLVGRERVPAGSGGGAHLRFRVLNADGDKAVSESYARIEPPGTESAGRA